MTNIVMVAFDDLNDWTSTLGGYGGTAITPNFDRLAQMGSVFANAFSTTPLCNPSRSSALTGMGPLTTGVFGNDTDLFARVDPSKTLPGLLKAAGYTTVTVGKVFHDLPSAVADRIYDAVLRPQQGGEVSGEDIPRLVDPTTSVVEGGKYTGDPALLDDFRNAQAVADFLDAYTPTAGSPGLFLSAGITRPHGPFIAPDEYFDLYPLADIVVPAEFPDDLNDIPGFADYFVDERQFDAFRLQDEWPQFVQAYLASVSFADAMLGKILDAIEASAIAADTVVVLWSDHGYHLGEKGHVGKFTLWDEAARSQLIIAAPGGEATEGRSLNTPVSLLDLYPTLLDYAGVAIPAWAEGESLRGLIETNDDTPLRGYAVTSISGSHSIRTAGWRYTRYEDGGEELYDLKSDPESLDNLAGEPAFAARQASLARRLEAQLDDQPFLQNRTGAPAVIDGSGGEYVLISGTDADTLVGGSGDNYYIVRTPGVTIVEAANGGYDTVLARSSYTLGDNLEFLRFAGSTGLGGDIFLNGNGTANLIRVITGRATVDGAGGDDTLQGERGADGLYGGLGDDLIEAERGEDTLDGGAGDDTLRGNDGDDRYVLSQGQDSIVEREDDGFDVIDVSGWGGLDGTRVTARYNPLGAFTGLVLDHIGGTASTTVNAVGGRSSVEAIVAGSSLRLLVAGVGVGTKAAETLIGSDGDDRLFGNGDNDRLDGGGGNDSVQAGDGDDTVMGGAGHDTLDGSRGEDTADYGAALAAVTLRLDLPFGQAQDTGGAGTDVLTGIEHVSGSGFADLLIGQAQGNRLAGGAGYDTLAGQGGDDTLTGGVGTDLLLGGGGSDRFVFTPAELGGLPDTIGDFEDSDVIDLTAFDAQPASPRRQMLRYIPERPDSPRNDIVILVDHGDTRIEVEIGDDADALVILLDGIHTLTAANFLL